MYVRMYVMYEGPKNLQTQSAWTTLPCHGGWRMWTHFHIWCTRGASHQSTRSVKWRSNQQRTVTSWLEASWPGRGTPRCWHRQQGTPPYRDRQHTSIHIVTHKNTAISSGLSWYWQVTGEWVLCIYTLGVGGIPVCSSIAVLNWYRSGIYLYVCHTGNRIPIIPWHNYLASVTFRAVTRKQDLN